MSDVTLKHIYKTYRSRDKRNQQGVNAVKDFNIDIKDNEFVVFVGPSGCGKSTTLRMIAGLESITSGELYIDGIYVNDTEPKDRNISMVFQNYALYPHMSAYQNIAFSLTLRKHGVPVYVSNDEVSSKLVEKKNREAEIKKIYLKAKSSRSLLSKLNDKLFEKKRYVTDYEYEINKDIYKNLHNKKAQAKLARLLDSKTKLEDEVVDLENKIQENKAFINESIVDIEKEQNAIKEIENSLKQYQKMAISKKLVSKFSKSLKYYEKLEKRDLTRSNKDTAELTKLNQNLQLLSSNMEKLNQNDEKELEKYYSLELQKEKIEARIKFLNDDIEVLNQRKILLEENINSDKEKLEFYKTNEQPVFKYVHYSKAEIDQRVNKAAQILDIEPLLNRKPREMSGGQRQRIALGRAIVREPKVFLLDEPLSNLDAKLRATMRSEISRLHEKLQTTFIYVTHDQIEAMTMGTRIVVMKDGVIQQIDTPTNLFDFPVNTFVAGFIGTPRMNFFDVSAVKDGNNLKVTFKDGTENKYPLANMRKIKDEYLDGEAHDLILGIRGENVSIAEKGISLTLRGIEILGNETHLHLFDSSDQENDQNETIVKLNYRVSYKENDKVCISLDESKIHLFDKDTSISIME